MITRNEVSVLVIESIQKFAKENEIETLISVNEDTRLFGSGSYIDSFDLVSLIVDLEESIQSKFGINMILADEKAMSSRTSPFVKVSSLIDHIFQKTIK
jgi:acyl carrier protein